MKQVYFICFFTFFITSLKSQDVAILELLYNQSAGNDKFELINNSSEIIDISTWWICARFGYVQLGNASQIEVLQGNLNMPPGSTIKMRLIFFDLHNTHSDFGIFTDSNFGSTSSMMDFLQYGDDADVGRGYVAVAKGIWRDMNPPNNQLDFIPTASSGNSTNWDGSNQGGGELTYSTDFINASPTLPIKLLTLTGRINNDKEADLIWTTIEEFNTEKHVVEKSIDGVSYAAIGEIASQNLGTATAYYTFRDVTPVLNKINFYRIRQIDLDGNEILSTPLMLKAQDVPNHSMFISPMPINGFGCFSMELYWPREQELADFRIIDMAGKVIERFAEPLHEGYNSVMHQFYGIEPGQYVMLISGNEGELCSQFFLISN